MIKNLLWLLLIAAPILASGKPPKKWKLAWQDNFSRKSIDYSRWSKIPRGKSEWDKYMSDADSCYAVRKGKLILRGVKNNNQNADTATYLTGGLYTKDKKAFGFGRLEIRAKLNGARGAWPAFWLLPQNGGWPDDGEIDIMERLNFEAQAYQTVHSHYTYTLKIKDPPNHRTIAIDPDGYNTYAIERYPDSLVFYVNGVYNFTYPKIKTDKKGQFPFDAHDYFLLIDMQLGGNWVGPVVPEDLPVEMQVDWVRFYVLNEKK